MESSDPRNRGKGERQINSTKMDRKNEKSSPSGGPSVCRRSFSAQTLLLITYAFACIFKEKASRTRCEHLLSKRPSRRLHPCLDESLFPRDRFKDLNINMNVHLFSRVRFARAHLPPSRCFGWNLDQSRRERGCAPPSEKLSSIAKASTRQRDTIASGTIPVDIIICQRIGVGGGALHCLLFFLRLWVNSESRNSDCVRLGQVFTIYHRSTLPFICDSCPVRENRRGLLASVGWKSGMKFGSLGPAGPIWAARAAPSQRG